MKEVERIIRVDHAGEYGAIQIYSAQLMISRLFYKDIVPKLEEMLTHEKQHFQTFDTLLKARGVRHCYALRLWAFGGFMLGLFTALLGRNAIWVCTNSIESTVLHHLEWQLSFLNEHDQEAHDAVLSIKADEEAHQEFGQNNGTESFIYKPIFWIVRKSTETAIWLSTKL
jgi:ubiquinone biosynthesis monooxygenase Coq7